MCSGEFQRLFRLRVGLRCRKDLLAAWSNSTELENSQTTLLEHSSKLVDVRCPVLKGKTLSVVCK